MPNLPAIIRPLFPALAHRLEFGKQDAQQGDQGGLLVPRQTLDVERADSGVDRSERQLFLEVGRLQGRNEALERARYEDRLLYREFADRVDAIHEGYARRRHETSQGYMSLRHKVAKWKYKGKRMAIKWGCIALAIAVFAIWVDHKLFSTDLAPSKPLPRYQSAVDR